MVAQSFNYFDEIMTSEKYLQVVEELQQYNFPTTLVLVSKNQPAEKIKILYDAGQRILAENRVQALLEKKEALENLGCKDLQWHIIGQLQRNKVKYIAPFISLIHSVDSLDLLIEINKQALKNNRIIDCLLQFHVAQEESKSGLAFAEAQQLLQQNNLQELKNIRIIGIMGMASFTDNEAQILNEFETLANYFQLLKQQYFAQQDSFCIKSMGMSSDYALALQKGANMLRIGSLFFN